MTYEQDAVSGTHEQLEVFTRLCRHANTSAAGPSWIEEYEALAG